MKQVIHRIAGNDVDMSCCATFMLTIRSSIIWKMRLGNQSGNDNGVNGSNSEYTLKANGVGWKVG